MFAIDLKTWKEVLFQFDNGVSSSRTFLCRLLATAVINHNVTVIDDYSISSDDSIVNK